MVPLVQSLVVMALIVGIAIIYMRMTKIDVRMTKIERFNNGGATMPTAVKEKILERQQAQKANYANELNRNQSSSQTTQRTTLSDGSLMMPRDRENALYDYQGTAKCDILAADAVTWTDPNAFANMTGYVDSFRFQAWKPSETNANASKMRQGKTYCMMYDDPGHNMVDNALRSMDKACSTLNPVFQSPIITNVFKDPYKDKTHELPIDK